ncbi:MAG: HEAT repeat domain-containing protein [Kofleriaceae bacterium]
MSFFTSSTITLDAALRDLASGNVKARHRAATALGDVEGATERRRAAVALTAALEDDAPMVRAAAAESLGALGELAPVPALIARLADGDSAVRQQAAIALGALRDPAGFPPLAEALREGPADLRFQAATSLAEIDAVAAYEPLVAALADRDAKVAAAAAVALGTLGDGRAVRHLAPLLEHADDDVRFEAAWALAELDDARGGEVLRAQLRSEPPSPRPLGRVIEAVEALARLGSPEEREALSALLASRAAQPEAAIVAARHVLALLGEGARDDVDDLRERQAAELVLLTALSARKEHLRGLAVEQLALVGGAWAEEPLRALARSRRGRALAEPIEDALAAIARRLGAEAPGGPDVDR